MGREFLNRSGFSRVNRGGPIEPPRHEGSSFPLVGPAVAVLAVHGILSAVSAPDPPRSWAAVVAAFATGYSALALLAGEHIRLSPAEVLAFSTGLAILITSLSALAVSVVGIPITQFVVVFVGLPVGVTAYITRRPPVPRDVVVGFLRKWFDFSDYSRGERGIAVVLLVSIALAVGVFIGLAGLSYPDTSSMALAITAANGRPDVPDQFIRNASQTIEVHVIANATPGPDPFTVAVRLVPLGATGNESFHPAPSVDPQTLTLTLDAFSEYNGTRVSVAPGGTVTLGYSIALDFSGDCILRFQLRTAVGAVLSEAYLSLTVTST